MSVSSSQDQATARLKERLQRMVGDHAGSANPRRSDACALKSKCQKCWNHSGVVLEAKASTVHAQLCDCVKSCGLCAGSCMAPKDGAVTDCAQPSPRRVIAIINEARIPARYIDADISKFEGFSANERSQKTTLMNWFKSLVPGKSSGLLLSGPVGLGKSWLLSAMAKHLAFQGISVRYADFFQLVHELRDAYANDLADKSSLKPLQNVDVLIIDELGKGRNTEWELSVADSLISERYNGNKCVIAATNYPLKGGDQANRQIDYLRADHSATNQMNAQTFEPLSQRIGSRMFSRLYENCLCLEISGSDRRRR
jgi:DNA replication protein DnaC